MEAYHKLPNGNERLPKYAYNYLKEGLEITPDGCLLSVFARKIRQDWEWEMEDINWADQNVKEYNYNWIEFPYTDPHNKMVSLGQSVNMIRKLVQLFDNYCIPWEIVIEMFRNPSEHEVHWSIFRRGAFPYIYPEDVDEYKKPCVFVIYHPSLNISKNHKRIDFRNMVDSSNLLIQAVFANNIEWLSSLLNDGYDVDSTDIGLTALYYACWLGRYEMAKLLIEKGATVDIADRYGNTPLFNALFLSKTTGEDLISLLVENGANADLMNNCGKTPRIIASYNSLGHLIPQK